MPAKAPAETCIGHSDHEDQPQLLTDDLIGPRASAESSETEVKIKF